jgi:hypothetical protein
MALLSRRRGEALTAAAQIVSREDLSGGTLSGGTISQAWQSAAWSFYDTLPEIHYPTQFTANSIGRFKFRIGVIPADDPTGVPVILETPDPITRLANEGLAELHGPFGDVSDIARRYAMNMMLAAEGYLIGTDKSDDVEWEFLSVSELGVDPANGTVFRNHYGDPTQQNSVEISPTYIRRFWMSHPRFSYAPDGPMKALQDDCERLRILNDSMTARLLNRLSQAGILFIPNTLSIANDPGVTNGDGPIVSDPFALKLLATFERQIIERQKGVIPIVVRGPDQAGDKIRHITLDRVIDESEMQLRAELRNNITTGLDLPPEMQTSLGEANHWQTWGIMDSTLRSHLRPIADGYADGLTSTYIWPYLRALDVDPVELRRRVVVADASEIVARPNEAEDGRALHDRITISDKALRMRSNAAEADAPDEDEYVRHLGRKINDPYLATFGMNIADDIDWTKVSSRTGGAPGVGGTPPSREPTDPNDPAGAPGEGEAGEEPEQNEDQP